MHEDLKWYYENGFRPIPVHGIADGHQCTVQDDQCTQCIGKVPMGSAWPDNDFDKGEDFPPGCNVALAMGKQTDGRWLVGLDIDGILDVERILHLPYTMECSTPRGRHLIYEVYPDAPLGNWNDLLHTRSKTQGYKNGYTGAVDLRYSRGALVSPPSMHASGEQYQWTNFVPPSIMPHEAIIDLIRSHKRHNPKVQAYPRWSANPAHKGKRP